MQKSAVVCVMTVFVFGWMPLSAAKKGNYKTIVNTRDTSRSHALLSMAAGRNASHYDWLEQEKKQEEEQRLSVDRMISAQLNPRKREMVVPAVRRRTSFFPARTFRQAMREIRQQEQLTAFAQLTDEEKEKLKKDSDARLEKERIAWKVQQAQEQRFNEKIRLMKEEHLFYMQLRAYYNLEKIRAELLEGESGRARVEAAFVERVEAIRSLEKRDKEMMLPRLWDIANIPSDVEGKQIARNFLDKVFPGVEEYFKVSEADEKIFLDKVIASPEEIRESVRNMSLL